MTDCIRVAKFKAEEAPGRDCPTCAAGWQGWPARRVNSAVRGRGGAQKWPTFSEPHTPPFAQKEGRSDPLPGLVGGFNDALHGVFCTVHI